MDPTNCTAIVDFNVPGKPNPPPVKLMATVWTQSLPQPKGTIEKYVIEWTDPSGKLASPEVPLNAWVQKENFVVKSSRSTRSDSCFQDSPIYFKDIHGDDYKQATLSGNSLTIKPFDSDDSLSPSWCAILDCQVVFIFSSFRI